MFLPANRLPARALAFICLASLLAVGAALLAQHGFGVKPCPWCVMQRGIFLLIAAAAGLGWLARASRPLRNVALGLALLLAVSGVAAAFFQHEVASKLDSCDMTLADRLLVALNLEELWPPVFMVTASCAEAAAYRLLGLPYEVWSGLLYIALGLLSVVALRSKR